MCVAWGMFFLGVSTVVITTRIKRGLRLETFNTWTASPTWSRAGVWRHIPRILQASSTQPAAAMVVGTGPTITKPLDPCVLY